MNRSVILITTVFNEIESMNEFLDSYLSMTLKPEKFIIVDGGSTDGTIEVLRDFQRREAKEICLIVDSTCNRKSCIGPIARGRNVAIEAAKGDIIAVTDAGCILDRDWLKEVVRPLLEDELVDVTSGWYEACQDTNFRKDFSKAIMPRLETVNPDTFLPSSRSIAFRKSAWERVKGYPENSYTGEDTLFVLNMKNEGLRFQFNPLAKVYWKCPSSLQELRKKQREYGYGEGLLRINIYGFCRNFASLIFPIWLFRRRLNWSQFRLRYVLISENQIGYIRGLFKL